MTMRMAGLAAVIGALICGGAEMAPTTFSPAEGDFIIAFSTAPTSRTEGGGRNQPGFRRYAARNAGQTFVVTVDQYPDHIRVPAPTKVIYQRLAWAHAQDLGVQLVSDEPVTVAGLAGWEGVYRLADMSTEVRRILMLGDRIYQLSATGPGEDALSPAGEAFFGSFRITAAEMARSKKFSGPAT